MAWHVDAGRQYHHVIELIDSPMTTEGAFHRDCNLNAPYCFYLGD